MSMKLKYVGRYQEEEMILASRPEPGALALTWDNDHRVYLYRADREWVSFDRKELPKDAEALLPPVSPSVSTGTRFLGAFNRIGDLPPGAPGDFASVKGDSFVCVERNNWTRVDTTEGLEVKVAEAAHEAATKADAMETTSVQFTAESGIEISVPSPQFLNYGDPSGDMPPPWMGCGAMTKDSGWHVVYHDMNPGEITSWAMTMHFIQSPLWNGDEEPDTNMEIGRKPEMMAIWGQDTQGFGFVITEYVHDRDRVVLQLPRWVRATRLFYSFDSDIHTIFAKRVDQLKDGWVPPGHDRHRMGLVRKVEKLKADLDVACRGIESKDREIRELKAHVEKLSMWDEL